MTCKDCKNQAKCKLESEKDDWVKAKIHNVNFWENAEKSCYMFEQKES